MHGNFFIGLIIISLRLPLSLIAQDPEILHSLEEKFLYQEEASQIPQELFEQYADLRNNPLNINCATLDQLAESGLFSPFQIHTLIKYKEKYGELYSILELASLNGFRVSRVQEISPFITVGPCIKRNKKGRVKHMVLLNAGRIFPSSAGFREDTGTKSGLGYVGSPVRTDVRIRSHLGNSLSTGITYEKDAGESFFNRHKPEHLSGYIQYHGHRQLKQVVLGNFQLHNGLGLVNGTGFIHSPASFILNRGSMMRIRPFSSKSESRYERGLGVRLKLRKLSLLYWASFRELDLNTEKLILANDKIDWLEYIRETGLHRTSNELAGRTLANRVHSGVQVLYRQKQLDVGILFGIESFGLSKEGIRSMGFILDRELNSYISLHGRIHKGKWQLFGELALSDFNATALLAGATWHLNDFWQGVFLLHHYHKNYGGSFPSAYAHGSKINNETGAAIHLQLIPGQLLLVRFTGEVFHFPGPRYLCAVPSNSYKYGLTFQNGGVPEIKWRLKFTKKFWQTTPAGFAMGLNSLVNNESSRIDLRFVYDRQVQWQSKLIIAYGSDSKDSYPGYAIAQQISILPFKSLRTTLQFVVFEVADWDHRIYLHEPGLYYDFSFPVCYGSGQKVVVTLKIKPKPGLSISSKMVLTTYNNRDALGTGNNLIAGNERWMLALQFRLDL